MRVRAFMKYGVRAASARQRLLQFLPYLREHGVHVDVLPLLDDDHLARLTRGQGASPAATARAYARRVLQLGTRTDHDVTWVQYELFPYLPGVLERLATHSGSPLVVDFDDAIFHQYDAHPSAFVRALLGRKLQPLLRRASLCIGGNEYLQRHLSRECPTTMLIPTVVDTAQYRPAQRVASGGPVVIGWIGSPSTWPYVEAVLPVIRSFVERGEAVFRVVGGGVAADRYTWLTSVPWTEATEILEVQRMDVGIMPVPDDIWARGKCGYKLIQYMACGLPVVASPVGVNTSIVTDEENGILATSPSEWEVALRRLIDDTSLRLRFGDAGRVRTVSKYSLASQEPRLLRALTNLRQRA